MLSFIIGLLYVVEILACVLLALVVMIQKPKEGGLGGVIGGASESVFGANANSIVIKATIVLGSIFLINTLLLSRLSATGGSSVRAPEAPAALPAAEAPAPTPAAQPAPVQAPAPAAKPVAAKPTTKPAPAAKPVAKPVAAKPAAKPVAPAKPASK